MIDPDTQSLILGAHILRVMIEANGGRELRTIWHYRRVAQRFGVRIRFVSREALDQAILRQGRRAGRQGVILVPFTHDMGRLRRHLIHELAEAATLYEGVPSFVCQISRHEAAQHAESLCFRRR